MNFEDLILIYLVPPFFIWMIVLFIRSYQKKGFFVSWMKHQWEFLLIVGSLMGAILCVSAARAIDYFALLYYKAIDPFMKVAECLFLLCMVFTEFSCYFAVKRKAASPAVLRNLTTAYTMLPFVILFVFTAFLFSNF